jgi:hypothetical protein
MRARIIHVVSGLAATALAVAIGFGTKWCGVGGG